MANTPILILACVVLMMAIVNVRIALIRWREDSERRRELLETDSAYHVEDYNADVRCDICFDSMDGEEVCDCSCGRTFHRTCAEPTGACPYCGKPFGSFPVKSRESRSLTCFRCGRKVERNICDCGTIIPFSDGTFYCQCGEPLNEKDTWCPNCGMTFERRRAFVDKSLIPKM